MQLRCLCCWIYCAFSFFSFFSYFSFFLGYQIALLVLNWYDDYTHSQTCQVHLGANNLTLVFCFVLRKIWMKCMQWLIAIRAIKHDKRKTKENKTFFAKKIIHVSLSVYNNDVSFLFNFRWHDMIITTWVSEHKVVSSRRHNLRLPFCFVLFSEQTCQRSIRHIYRRFFVLNWRKFHLRKWRIFVCRKRIQWDLISRIVRRRNRSLHVYMNYYYYLPCFCSTDWHRPWATAWQHPLAPPRTPNAFIARRKKLIFFSKYVTVHLTCAYFLCTFFFSLSLCWKS